METPTKLSEIESLISAQVQENLHLDYKRSDALHTNNGEKISKTISAFANSDGGVVIYGVVEEERVPIKIDSGVDHQKLSREWLEQIINSNVTPRIDGLMAHPIELNETKSIYVVEIPKSFRAPHQASDKLYYKRYNFLSAPMYDYEINDIRNRKLIAAPLINVDVEHKDGWIYLIVSNLGTSPATKVSFSIPSNLPWYYREAPHLLRNGTEYFAPNKTFRFRLNHSNSLFRPESDLKRQFDISATYIHPAVNQLVTENFYLDIDGYQNSLNLRTDVEVLTSTLKDHLTKLISESKKINESLERISEISGGSGLSLSVTTLRNLRRINSGDEELEKIDASYCSEKVFQKVLGIDDDLAWRLANVFRYNMSPDARQLEGLTDEILERMHASFLFDQDLVRRHLVAPTETPSEEIP